MPSMRDVRRYDQDDYRILLGRYSNYDENLIHGRYAYSQIQWLSRV